MSFKKHDFRYDFEVCCPYNKKHQMPFSKLWFHISKGCKDKRDKGHKYKVCPYNSLHIIILPKWDNHVQRCLSHINQNKDSEVDDIFQEMQKVAAMQFGNNQQQKQQQQQQQQIHQQNDLISQSAISSIPCKSENQIPNWGETYDSQSEITEEDIKEINEISAMNFLEEINELRQQKYSSSISKSFQSSGAKSKKQQDDDDDYYD